VVSPRGDVVGERLVAHPALSALRSIDRAIETVSASLGPTPAARRKMRADDGALAGLRDKEPRAKGDNPEYTAFRSSVRGPVDERLRELGLIT
jgi:hypothetical protein